MTSSSITAANELTPEETVLKSHHKNYSTVANYTKFIASLYTNLMIKRDKILTSQILKSSINMLAKGKKGNNGSF